MGCDIHIAIQRQGPDGVWVEIAYTSFANDVQQQNSAMARPTLPVAPVGFDWRDYSLFGILADVRNGVGFAGIITGEAWPSITRGRGWPEGFARGRALPEPEYDEDEPRDMGDHSFTWVSLDELQAYDWDGISATRYGIVTASDYELMELGKKPQQWCGDVAGRDVMVYDQPDYIKTKRLGQLAKQPYVRVWWQETARSATNDWPGRIIPWLERLADGRPLRLVLGFDS